VQVTDFERAHQPRFNVGHEAERQSLPLACIEWPRGVVGFHHPLSLAIFIASSKFFSAYTCVTSARA
jgi:hypothetical protein